MRRGSENRRLAYIGQDLYMSGQMMGERIVKLVGSGEVAIFIATPGQLNLQPRVDGAMDAIKKSGANIQATMIARFDRKRGAVEDPRLLSREPECSRHVRHPRQRHDEYRPDHAPVRFAEEGRACRRVRSAAALARGGA
jgi:hypothetical protein